MIEVVKIHSLVKEIELNISECQIVDLAVDAIDVVHRGACRAYVFNRDVFDECAVCGKGFYESICVLGGNI